MDRTVAADPRGVFHGRGDGERVGHWLREILGTARQLHGTPASNAIGTSRDTEPASGTHNRTTRAQSFNRPDDRNAPPKASLQSPSSRRAAPKFHTDGARRPTRARSIYDFDAMVAARREREALPPRVDHNRAPHVLIVGAGLAGLCLAQGLKKNGITFTVFERDPAPHFTSQGYRVHVDEAAYDALKASLPSELFDLFLQAAGEVFPAVVYRSALTGEALRIDQGLKTTQRVFSVDRAMLRSLLLSGLEDGKEIQFDAEFKRFHVLPNGLVEIHFENGCFMQGTMLVGADGPMSRVRLQHLPRRLQILDTECAVIYGKTRITPELRELGLAASCTTVVLADHPRMALVIEPECLTKLDGYAFLSPFGDVNPELDALHEYISWALLTRVDIFYDDDDLRVQDLYAMTSEEVAAVAVHLTTDWHPVVRTIVDLQAREWTSFTKISTTEPHIPTWPSGVVTLVGDAVHTLPPSGLACGAALQDASELCAEFVHRGVNIAAVAAYETGMRARAAQNIHKSLATGSELYGLPPLGAMKIATWES